MTRPLFFLLAIGTIYFYFAAAILGLGIPADSTKNASQVTIRAKEMGKSLGLQARGLKGISNELFDTFQLMAQYSAAAYCSGNNNSTNTSITCPGGNCPLVEEAGARSVVEFQNIKTADDTGFIALDETNQLIVLSFRGSRSDANWSKDWKITHASADLCPRCAVHKGYWTSWLEIRDTLTPLVLHVIKTYPDFRFAITGHSLGGALATIAAGALRDVNDDLRERTELYSFGSPRVGNEMVAYYLSMQSDRSYRITNRKDAVPRLPPWILGYHHTYPEYYITHHAKNPSPEDFEYIRGHFDGGNTQSGDLVFGYRHHHLYFMNDISACSNKEKDHSRD